MRMGYVLFFFLDCYVEATLDACKQWFGLIDKNSTRDIHEDAANLTLEIIGKAGFGHDFDSFHAGSDPNSFKSRVSFLMPRVHIYCLIPKFIRDYLSFGWVAKVGRDVQYFKEEIKKMINTRRKLIQEKKNTSKDLLSLLLSGAESEDGLAPLTDRELVSNVFVFLLAGHETTANSLTFTLYWLCRCPDIQEKARKVVDEVLNGAEPTYEDLDRLEYLDHIIKETLRLTPVVPMNSRTTKVPIQYQEYTLPPETIILIQLSAYHTDEEYFDEPNVFKPERWENMTLKHPFSYNPVSDF
jgi:cytochrome P450